MRQVDPTRARTGRRRSIAGCVGLILCLAPLGVSIRVRARLLIPAQNQNTSSNGGSQTAGRQLLTFRLKPAARAVVNFAQLAREEASRPAVRGPLVPQVIHSPVTPPEADINPSSSALPSAL